MGQLVVVKPGEQRRTCQMPSMIVTTKSSACSENVARSCLQRVTRRRLTRLKRLLARNRSHATSIVSTVISSFPPTLQKTFSNRNSRLHEGRDFTMSTGLIAHQSMTLIPGAVCGFRARPSSIHSNISKALYVRHCSAKDE